MTFGWPVADEARALVSNCARPSGLPAPADDYTGWWHAHGEEVKLADPWLEWFWPERGHRLTRLVGGRQRWVPRVASCVRSAHPDAMNLLDRITVEPGKCGGRPCIRGQRIRVTDVLDLLSHGASQEEILEDYPFLEREDILAAIAYASRLTDHVVLRAA